MRHKPNTKAFYYSHAMGIINEWKAIQAPRMSILVDENIITILDCITNSLNNSKAYKWFMGVGFNDSNKHLSLYRDKLSILKADYSKALAFIEQHEKVAVTA